MIVQKDLIPILIEYKDDEKISMAVGNTYKKSLIKYTFNLL